ncbi:hypothetical protein ACRALDRAFT_2019200 [Sodiomyces alcalophilus JCM 7366]|uniref:uncharacterized protein n=1 Tax=Sodiomyces alcalophilus JCM 7366 TaxID=591952 RepID=UPI0039B5FC3E
MSVIFYSQDDRHNDQILRNLLFNPTNVDEMRDGVRNDKIVRIYGPKPPPDVCKCRQTAGVADGLSTQTVECGFQTETIPKIGSPYLISIKISRSSMEPNIHRAERHLTIFLPQRVINPSCLQTLCSSTLRASCSFPHAPKEIITLSASHTYSNDSTRVCSNPVKPATAHHNNPLTHSHSPDHPDEMSDSNRGTHGSNYASVHEYRQTLMQLEERNGIAARMTQMNVDFSSSSARVNSTAARGQSGDAKPVVSSDAKHSSRT